MIKGRSHKFAISTARLRRTRIPFRFWGSCATFGLQVLDERPETAMMLDEFNETVERGFGGETNGAIGKGSHGFLPLLGDE